MNEGPHPTDFGGAAGDAPDEQRPLDERLAGITSKTNGVESKRRRQPRSPIVGRAAT